MSKKQRFFAWDSINWLLIQKRIRRIQNRIYKAKKLENIKKMYWLQNHLIHSFDAKLFVVKKISTFTYNDKIEDLHKLINMTNEQKLKLAHTLQIDGTSAEFTSLKFSKNTPINVGFSILQTIGKQELIRLALEPQTKAVTDLHLDISSSTHSAQQAMEMIVLALNNPNKKWIWSMNRTTLLSTFSNPSFINSLHTFPRIENQIQSWLHAGIMEKYMNSQQDLIYSTKTVISPICRIVPILMNLFFQNIENRLIVLNKHEQRQRPTLIRFKENFVLIHEDKKRLRLDQKEILNYLNLKKINRDQFSIQNSQFGFSFLGFQIIQIFKQEKSRVKITPSKNSQKRLLKQTRLILQTHKAVTSYQLIRKLRPLILEWGHYFKYCECGPIYSNLSHRIHQQLRAWVFRRDPRSSRHSIKEKYFPNNKTWNFQKKTHISNWVFYGKEKDNGHRIRENFLPPLTWICTQKGQKIHRK